MIQRSQHIASLLALVRTGVTPTTDSEREFVDELAYMAGVVPPSHAYSNGTAFAQSYFDYLAQAGLQALRSGQ